MNNTLPALAKLSTNSLLKLDEIFHKEHEILYSEKRLIVSMYRTIKDIFPELPGFTGCLKDNYGAWYLYWKTSLGILIAIPANSEPLIISFKFPNESLGTSCELVGLNSIYNLSESSPIIKLLRQFTVEMGNGK